MMARTFGRTLLVSVAVIALPTAASGAVTLNFEGIATYPTGSGTQILEYYNGGAAGNGAIGPDYGVSFTTGAQLLCLNTLGTFCSNTSKGGGGVPGSQFYGMFFLNENPYMNVEAGFDTGFSFAYANPNGSPTSVTIYEGLNGTGNVLAAASLGATPNGSAACPNYGAAYCPFQNVSLAFSGIAQSVLFGGQVNQQAFDDFTFGSTVVGGAVPEPATWAMMLLGFGFVGGVMRSVKRRQKVSVNYA